MDLFATGEAEPNLVCLARAVSPPADDVEVRAAEPADLGPIVEIYNEGVEDGVATCDLSATTAEERREWFAAHASRLSLATSLESVAARYASETLRK